MGDSWGAPITPVHAKCLKETFAAARKQAWCYYTPFLCAFSLPPNRVVRVLERETCVCLMVERPDGIDFLCPPVPFVAEVFDDLLNELVMLNGDRSTRVLWVDADDATRLEPARFAVQEKDAEYLYDPKLIVNAEGRAFRDVRKRVHRFERENDAVFRPMVANDIGACHVLLRYWRKRQGRKHPFLLDWGYTRAALDAFAVWPTELLRGWCVEIEGVLTAFALAGEMRPDLAQFFVAKADPDVLGLAEYLRCGVYKELLGYRLVNDAGDLGLAGLKQFKMKFRPVDQVQMYSAEVRKEGH